MAFDALFTGISGLNAYQSWIDMISNNIANTATTGFKDQRMTFADMFYQQIGAPSGPTATSGGVNPQDQGLGVKVNTIDTLFAQGGLQTTGVNTDLALDGNGFFILRPSNQSGAPTYTRDGAFSLNANGLLYDPASGLAVQGYMASTTGTITQTGTPGDITIPIGLAEQATATGQGVKVGPALNDQDFDMQIGGNLDQTQWAQQFLNDVGASINPGTTKTISTTVYDSLGNSHQLNLTYSPDATGATAATVASAAGPVLTAPATVAPATSTADTITVKSNGNPPDTYTITDTLGNNQTSNAGAVVTMGGATFTLVTPAPAAGTSQTIKVKAATNGLPSTVQSAAGVAEPVGSRWAVTASFTDGTQFATIATAGKITAAGAVTPPTYGTGSSGVIGYVYFNQNGQFINTSSIEGVALTGAGLPQGITAADAVYLHTAGGGQPNINQGNQLNVLTWGPGAGNPSQAPTAGAPAPAPGPIAIDYSDNASLAGAYSANVVSQNGYAAGTLDNINIEQDGTIAGSFTNGQTKTLAQIALATFQNEQGLSRIGSNQFEQTAASGLAQLGTGNSGSFGTVVSGSLEQSNVNLADEFTNLIVAQRAFEANSRGITTADQNLITLINLRASEN